MAPTTAHADVDTNITDADQRRICLIIEELSTVNRQLGLNALIRYAAETATARSENGTFDHAYTLSECYGIVERVLDENPTIVPTSVQAAQEQAARREKQCETLVAAATDCMRNRDREKALTHLHEAAQINPDAPAVRNMTVSELEGKLRQSLTASA